MERIELCKVDRKDGEVYAVFAVRNGFEYTFEINGSDGYEASYATIEDLMEDLFIFVHGIGFYRLKAIAKRLLSGEDPQLDDDEREVLE